MGRNDGIERRLDALAAQDRDATVFMSGQLGGLGEHIDRLADKLTDQLGGVPQQSRLINALETIANQSNSSGLDLEAIVAINRLVEAVVGRPAIIETEIVHEDDCDADDYAHDCDCDSETRVLTPSTPGVLDHLSRSAAAQASHTMEFQRLARAVEKLSTAGPKPRRHDADIVTEVDVRASSLVPGDVVWWVSGPTPLGEDTAWAGYRKVTAIAADRKLLGMIQVTVYDAETDLDYTTPFAGLDLVTVQNPIGSRYQPGYAS